MGILGKLRRRRISTAFGNYVSPEAIEKLLRETGSEIRSPEVKHFQYVVAMADDTNPEEVPATTGKIVQVLIEHHATVTYIMSSLVVALLGVPFPAGNSAGARRELVEALLRENGNRIRIVQGECDGAVGNFGGPKRWSYGAVIPGFSGILKRLIETGFGAAVEIS
jgi:hypothetical protein